MTEQPPRDRDGRIPLHQAAALGTADEVARLIAEGQDLTAVDKGGRTPLHMAAIHGRTDNAKLLLAAGAPIHAKDGYGNEALWNAVFRFQGGQPDLILLLLDAGADPDLTNVAGKSPRDVAIGFSRPGIEIAFPNDIPGR